MFRKKGLYDILIKVPDYKFLELNIKRTEFRYGTIRKEEFLYYASRDPNFEVSLDFWDGRFEFTYNNFTDMVFIHYFFNFENNVICNIDFK